MKSVFIGAMEEHIAEAQAYFTESEFEEAASEYAIATDFAKEAQVKVPSLIDLKMDSLFVDCMNRHIQKGQSYLTERKIEDAEEEFIKAEVFSKKAGVQMLSIKTLSLGFIRHLR